MGRPRSKIDWKKVDNYLKAGCTGTQVASVLGICPETLYRACEHKYKVCFAVYSQEKRESGDALLHAKQFQTAMEGDKTMLVWLGKQRLNQREKQEISGVDGKDLISGSVSIHQWISENANK